MWHDDVPMTRKSIPELVEPLPSTPAWASMIPAATEVFDERIFGNRRLAYLTAYRPAYPQLMQRGLQSPLESKRGISASILP